MTIDNLDNQNNRNKSPHLSQILQHNEKICLRENENVAD
jgi:hypothetical protein